MNQPPAPKFPVPEPSPLPSNFPGGLKAELLALGLILVAFAALCFGAFRQESVTVDEFAHLPAGLFYLRNGDFRLNPDCPPLIRMFAALPLLNRAVKLPSTSALLAKAHFIIGEKFMYENRQSYHSIFLRGRAMILSLGVILVLLTWWWARSLYGSGSGILAAGLAAFCPNIMAHSGLATVDLGTSLAFLGTIYFFWRYCRKPSMVRAAGAGLFLGIALLSKFSSVILIPIQICLLIVDHLRGGKELNLRATTIAIIIAGLAAWLTLNTGYFWQGVGMPLSQYSFKSQTVTQLVKILPPNLPLPLPHEYLSGFDMQSAVNERSQGVYFFGETSPEGKWYYYFGAMAVKMTLASLALILAGLISMGFGKKSWRDELFLLIPAAAIVGSVSILAKRDVAFRYLLPAIPFLYILAARIVSRLPGSSRWLQVSAWFLLAFHLASNLMIYPHYLSYFNLAAGGPQNGRNLLIGSNLDWGQDLMGLKKYMDDHQIESICLAYFGSVDPEIYGIVYEIPSSRARCTLFAVSVSYLSGGAYFLTDHGRIIWTKPRPFHWLNDQKPIASIGYSILVFDLAKISEPKSERRE